MKENKLITVKEASKLIGIKIGPIYVAVRDGEIKRYQIGRRIYFKSEDVYRWMETKVMIEDEDEIETEKNSQCYLPNNESFSVKDAAKFAVLSYSTMLQLIKSGTIDISDDRAKHPENFSRNSKYAVSRESVIEYMKTPLYKQAQIFREKAVKGLATVCKQNREETANTLVFKNLIEINIKLDLLLSELGVTVK